MKKIKSLVAEFALEYKRIVFRVGLDWQSNFDIIRITIHDCGSCYGFTIALLSIFFAINFDTRHYDNNLNGKDSQQEEQ